MKSSSAGSRRPLAVAFRAAGRYNSNGEHSSRRPRAALMGLITAPERMRDGKLRQAIALEAARLMYERVETEYFTAKRKAAKRLCRQWVKPEDLPSNAEIRDQIQLFARIHEGDRRTENLRDMRLEALRLMRLLRAFQAAADRQRDDRPRPQRLRHRHPRFQRQSRLRLRAARTGRLPVRRGTQTGRQARREPRLHAHPRLRPFQLRADRLRRGQGPLRIQKLHHRQGDRTSVDPRAGGTAGGGISRPRPRRRAASRRARAPDPYPVFRMLLLPLEKVPGSPVYHPEGDVLYHSLAGVRAGARPSALRRGVPLGGAAARHRQGTGPARHVEAALEVLEGLITDRTRFLIEHHMHAHDYRAGKLGAGCGASWRRRRISRI